jgi:hypothetical protein
MTNESRKIINKETGMPYSLSGTFLSELKVTHVD